MSKGVRKMLVMAVALLMLLNACAPSGIADGSSLAASTPDVADSEPGTPASGEQEASDFAHEQAEILPPTREDIEMPEGMEIVVGYLSQNQTDEFIVLMGDLIQDEAAKYGGQVTVQMSDAQSSAATQVSQAEDMAVKAPDVVIINAVDKVASAPAVNVLVEAGIPVVLLNTAVDNQELAHSYVGIDDVEVGRMLMQMVGDALQGEGTINVIQGLLGHPCTEYRWEGIQLELAENYPNITIGSAQPADWDRGKAMNVTEDWLASNAQFDAIISMNDEMAIASMHALSAAGISDIPIVGGDALDEMLDLIKEGRMYGTVFQNADLEARGVLNVAVAVALGMEVEPIYYIPNEITIRENVDEYIGRNILS